MSFPERADTIPSSVLEFVQRQIQPQGLSHIQEITLDMCWSGATYQEISEATGYDDSYIRAVGAQLWQSLTKALEQKITKNTFRVLLKQRLLREEHSPTLRGGRGNDLELPQGQVPLGSALYIERAPIESTCHRRIAEPGALIRIKSSQQTGKTSLMARVVQAARAQNYATVTLNLELANADILADVDRFFRWFCIMVSKSLHLPVQIDDFWEDLCGSSYNCSEYFGSYLLPSVEQPVVLALDNVDVIFNYPDVAADFFGMLRAWYERARYGSSESAIWQKLRLFVVYSTEVYISLPTSQSPFNVGMLVELPDFTIDQVEVLIARHQLNWSRQEAESLLQWVGGNPYLVRLTLYHAKQFSISLEDIWENAIAPHSIYTAHLKRKFWALQPHALLLSGLQQVMLATDPQQLEPVTLLKLDGMGLISIHNGKASSACDLYYRYFRSLFTLS